MKIAFTLQLSLLPFFVRVKAKEVSNKVRLIARY
jgi:hypothetical protein